MLNSLSFLLTAAAVLLSGCTAGNDSTGPIVSLGKQGLRGEYLDAQTGLAVFRGIPYAQPPVGELRWQAPRKRQPASGIRPATEFAPPCVQPDGEDGNVAWYWRVAEAFGQDRSVVHSMPRTSEDCLYLNIWTTAPGKPAKLPVMVWLHGGANETGWSHERQYHGHHLAINGVVYVSINYRLGEFGYLAHPQLSKESGNGSSGNYGLQDQIAALQWIAGNIDRFGGDPDNVTIFGESAGSANVGFLLASPLAQGLFHRAISQSGAYQIGKVNRLAEEEQRGIKLAAALQIADDKNALNKLRSKPAADILAAARGLAEITEYGPNVDGHVLTDTPGWIYYRGRQHDVPLIIGANSDEWRMYSAQDITAEDLSFSIAGIYTGWADALEQVYTQRTEESPRLQYARFWGDEYFICPSLAMAGYHAKKGSPVWFYFFDRTTPGGEGIGAYHGAEYSYLFHTPEPWIHWSEEDRQLAAAMTGYWISFARNGNPDTADLPAWPAYTLQEKTYMKLGAEITTSTDLRRDECRYFERTLPKRWEFNP